MWREARAVPVRRVFYRTKRCTRRVLLPAVAHRATVSSCQCAWSVTLEDCVRDIQT